VLGQLLCPGLGETWAINSELYDGPIYFIICYVVKLSAACFPVVACFQFAFSPWSQQIALSIMGKGSGFLCIQPNNPLFLQWIVFTSGLG
jgi:hypothetical protein